MRLSFALAASALCIATAAVAQAPTAPNPDPRAVRAGRYTIEPSHTRVLFAVNHMGFTTWYGEFTGAEGTLSIDPRRPAMSRVEVSVPTASVSTSNAKLDGELKSADWFDARRFPTISFRSTRVTPTGPGRANVMGDLTLHGVTRPVTLQAKFNAAGVAPVVNVYSMGFEVSGKIRRSDFGVGKYVPLVGDEVTLMISAGFEDKGGGRPDRNDRDRRDGDRGNR